MNDAIYISIKPNPTSKIVEGVKNHEFRNYIPKKKFKFLYVYVTTPISELRYVIEIGEIVKYPDELKENGEGNLEFNNGEKSKYAYPILKVHELETSIHLKELKEKFGFVPPQAFSYDNSFLDLTNYIEKAKKVLIVENEIK